MSRFTRFLAALAASFALISSGRAALDVSPADGIPDIWALVQGVSGLTAAGDDDGDGQTNVAEAAAGTNPKEATDVLRIKGIAKSGSNVTLVFPVILSKKYEVQGATSLSAAFATIGAAIVPPSDNNNYSTVVAAGSSKFFRVLVSDLDSDGDGLSNYEERMIGLNPSLADSDGDGVSDLVYVNAQLALPDTLAIRAVESIASEDGPTAGEFEIYRSRSLFAANVPYTVSGTATVAADYAALAGSVSMPRTVTSVKFQVIPNSDALVEGSESVTVTLTPPQGGLGSLYVLGSPTVATVIIVNKTAPAGTGLAARYYDHANATYAHAANFGDAANYAFTRNTSPTTTGTIVLTPTTGNLTNILNALSVGSSVKLSFLGGNLNNVLYNSLSYAVTAKTATNFTVSITGAAALPTSSSSTCNFSIQSVPHPAVIDRVDPTVDFTWLHGTPNGVVISPNNSPENYSATWEGYLNPTTAGSYVFQLDADDKARVFVDLNRDGDFLDPGEQVIEHGWDATATVGTFKQSAPVALAIPANASERYKIRIEHVETVGDARCRLQWNVDGGGFVNIPQPNQFTHTQPLTYSYSGGNAVITPTGGHTFIVGDTVTLAFSSGVLFTPGAASSYNNTYSITAVTGTTYTVAITGFPISVTGAATTAGSNLIFVPSTTGLAVGMALSGTGLPANELITAIGIGTINVTTGTGVTAQASTTLTAVLPPTGTATGNGFVLNNSSSTTTGLFNLCYANTTFANSPGRVGVDAAVTTGNNGIWGTGTPDVTLIQPDSFSIRWTGQVQPQFSEDYTFVVQADDGCSLWINGQPQILKMVPSASTGGSNYTYDSTTGDMLVTYTGLIVNPNSFVVGETVRIDPTSGNLLHNPTTSPTYSYDGTTGVAVIDYTNLTNVTPGGFVAGGSIELDPTTGTLSALGIVPYTILAVPAPTATTFAISFGTGTFATGTGNITIADTRNSVITAATSNTFTVNIGAGKYVNASAGNVSVDIVNKALKEWSSNGNERFVRIPMVGGVRYDIQLDYYETTSSARCNLSWYSPSQPKQIIPAERLYPSSGTLAPTAHTGSTDATALVGGPFSYSVGGSNGGVVTVSPLPAGLTQAGGVISGTPAAAGDYQVIITITNSAGTSTSVLNLHVENTGAAIPREYWNGVAGTTVANLSSVIGAGTLPTGTANLVSLEAPTDFGDDYGARIRGYITAPETGNYYFWLAASNAAELWISNDAEPVNALKRAAVLTGSTTPRTWNIGVTEPGQKSPWLALEQGRKYYIEILHKAGTGAGDNLAVGWLKPGESGSAPSEVVPGYALSPYVPPSLAATPGTLYFATMLAEPGAVGVPSGSPVNGVGTATLRLSADENTAYMKRSYSGLTGAISSEHIHSDPYLAFGSQINYDIDAPVTPGDGLITNPSDPNYTGTNPQTGTYRWTILGVATLSKADIIETIKQGKAYINLHTGANPNGEIRGNFTLANGSRSFSTPPAPPAWTDDSNTSDAASRFLTQASFGANAAEIAALKALSATGAVPASGIPANRYNTWIENQFLVPVTQHLPEVLAREIADAFGPFDVRLSINTWWKTSISAPDQLRQRVAQALSEIHVVSTAGPLQDNSRAISDFYDTLLTNAFGNFKDILIGTTLTPGMGRYLDMLGNSKQDLTTGKIPNENYAREIMQLFSIGLYRMWPDGSLILDSTDSPVDTYTQREIVGVAHVFSGWYYGYDGGFRTNFNAAADWTRPMREVPLLHDTGPKRILNNEVLPGLQTVGGQPLDPNASVPSTTFNDPAFQGLPAQELTKVHEQLFNHPNVGPFISRQLIQRLVTSNPSRDYLYRVVQKFNDNGSGVRGDMKAVIKAVLLDYEARSNEPVIGATAKPTYGKQREPMMRVANAARAFRPNITAGTYAQTGTPAITVTSTGAPHLLVTGSDVFLEFTDITGDPAKPAPSTGSYIVTGTPSNTSYTVDSPGWISGTYNQPTNSSVMTITMSSHWLPAGGQAYFDFTNGAANALAGFDNVPHTVATSNAVDFPGGSGNNAGTSFTIAGISPTTASARSGNVMIPRFTGSYGASGGRITLDTSFVSAGGASSYGTQADHGLVAGTDSVFINFITTRDTTSGSPTTTENDLVYSVDTVPDPNSFTVIARAAANAAINNDNGVFIFPLKTQPLTRNGTVNRRAGTFNMDNTDLDIGQTPLSSPTVFNYFLPEYKYPGTLASQGITTPEFQGTAETTVLRHSNFIYNGVFNPDIITGLSSFKTGTDAMLLDLSPWMGNAVNTAGAIGNILGNGVLGAGQQIGQRWTSNANLPTLIDRLNTLLMAGQLPAGAKASIQNFLSRTFTIGSLNSPVVITSNGHGLVNGDSITISGVTGGTFSTPINATFTVSNVTASTFTVPSNYTAVNSLSTTAAHFSPIAYNNGSPSTTNTRDRLRAIVHFILTSPDYTIQR